MALRTSAELAGRAEELASADAVLSAAAGGHSRTLVVTGPTGIGKTALVEAACAELSDRALLLVGGCLPLQTLTVPLLPLRSALRESRAPGHEACLAEMEVVDKAPRALDAYLDDLTATTPVIVFVDDVQWADQSTLDVLHYLAAGPTGRPLALAVTARDQGLPDDHPLHRWLADVLRLPRVSRLQVGGLDRTATEQVLTTLMGSVPHQSLVEDVFGRAAGNPYLTRLLAGGLRPSARRLPEGLPEDLSTAVMRSWRELSGPAREMTSLVAVAGRPVTVRLLTAVADGLGMGAVTPAVQEGLGGHVLRQAGDTLWFHHPLQAEVLAGGLDVVRGREWNAAYASALETAIDSGDPVTLESAVALSDYYHRAEDLESAYRWALRAWEVAERTRASRELLRVLQRAIDLHPRISGATDSLEVLLDRLRVTAEATGVVDEELQAVEALVRLVDPAERPLIASQLRVRRRPLLVLTGAGLPGLDDARAAVDLAATAPASWQHAAALAELARSGVWLADPDAGRHATRAVEIARGAGDPRALSLALTARGMVAVQEGRSRQALADTREACESALVAGDWRAYTNAVLWQCNAMSPHPNEATADLLLHRRDELEARGAPHLHVADLAVFEAQARLMMGDGEACRDLLRITLGSDPYAFVDAQSRVTAAMLDAWQGRTAQARMHLDRAGELLGGTGSYGNVPIATASALVAICSGQPEVAFGEAMTGARADGLPPHLCEWLVPLAARAVADRLEADRDRAGVDGAEGLLGPADLDRLLEEFPRVLVDGPDAGPTPLTKAMQAWYDAEVARARRDARAGAMWTDVATMSDRASLPWVSAYAWWRAAEAFLSESRSARPSGIQAWRKGRALADLLGAASIAQDLDALARIARVPPAPDVAPAVPAEALPGLTAREREVLDLVVAGATYAEIAERLVISEKTVSSHVSHLLRKTGTSSRVELSRLVARRRETSDGG
ncbi:MAG TPA: AAA family ATPase [Nocardioides sp.]|nr:AAA family ATPase [Nocardioides sp.]